ncbi:hypothetical protein [Mucilaginibacter sp.]
MKRILLLTSVALLFAFTASAQKMIAVKEVAQHINENVTVCGKVFGTKLLDGPNITFLDMGAAHPNQLLTVVIKSEDRSKFTGKPEDDYKDKNVCVTGTIIEFKGKPEIVLSDPANIKLDTNAK